MKILVDEMPLNVCACPFSEVLELPRTIKFYCKLTNDYCDLDCGTCSCLKLMETKG